MVTPEEQEKITLEFTPGLLCGTIASDKAARVSIPVQMLEPAAKDGVLHRLSGDPQALYRLLQSRPAPWLDEWAPSSVPDEGSAARCTCGRAACEHAAAVLEAARERLAAEPLQRLALLGLPREALLAGVFGAWAEAAPPAARGSAEEAAARPKEKALSGPSPGEWLAEAAAEGRLHRPGPLLQEVEVRLAPPPPPGQLGPAGDWAGLLPQVRGASKALGLVVREAANKAERRRRGLKSK
ncbi:hypothetical protein SAMN05661091_5332 [Paenibacillus uliginis N3/975]|uniref:SWIM-type domain-containing protein n=1 Tax=Paenibacillus uliginis N3/975 TaxID=1313296 RepID=A0A1X7HQN2_9BACL|nr:hypothetical protein [Paenibacillus uliginis]SMF91047.1 hypothetical protein SAMN05661091_5332 [Paenibacillus uliginis N3/975]